MRIDQNTAQGQALQKRVQSQLKEYLGTDYADDVLPLYIVVMLAHGNDESQVAENLDAFLGAEDAGKFATWYACIVFLSKDCSISPLRPTTGVCEPNLLSLVAGCLPCWQNMAISTARPLTPSQQPRQ